MISERVARLRQRSLDARPTLSPERADVDDAKLIGSRPA